MINDIAEISAAGWRAEIDPARGANLIRARYRDWDALSPESPERANPLLSGAPLLLPANRTAGGSFSFAGKTYALPVNEPSSGAHLHGMLYRQRFEICAHARDMIRLEYVNAGEIYPFAFRMRVTYRAGEAGLRADYDIENLSGGDMPLTFGLHATFPEPESFSVPLRARQPRDARNLPIGGYVPLDEAERRYCVGSPSRGRAISGYYLSGGDTARIGARLRYQASGFDHWILYNGGGAQGFLCIEPQLGAVDALNDPGNCPVIPRGGALRLQTRLFCAP